MKIGLFVIGVLLLNACTHDPSFKQLQPASSFVTITATCKLCGSQPICPIVDDIVVNTTTTYKTCIAKPAGQGSFSLNANNCLVWTSAQNHTDIINTCIIACTDGACDTTNVTILPPLPSDTVGSPSSCNQDSVYFEKDIFEVITSNCSYSGCHSASSAAEGIILNNYANIIKYGKIKAGKPLDSELYKVIVTTNAKDIMPPPPAQKLSSIQITLIQKWITQGAKNNTCNQGSTGCEAQNISFNNFVKPALASCVSCHKTGNAGGGINLDSYQGFKSAATSGLLYGSMAWSSGFIAMPQGGVKLSDCTIKKVKGWIDSGTLNN